MIAFQLRTKLRAGIGVSSEAVAYAREQGCARVGVVIDAGLSGNEHATGLVEELRSAVDSVAVYESDAVEPDYDYLDDFKSRLDAGLDLIVAMGGGSTLDLAKAVSVLVTNEGPAISYRGFDLIRNPGIPLIAIPTTAGTGSEVTPNAVFTDRVERRKLGINTELYLPVLVLLDPLLVRSCPRGATISAGLDALVHATESYVAAGATPVTRPLSREAFRLVNENLPRVVDDPDDLDAWLSLQLGAFFAGSALFNSGAGPAGALSYPIGVLFGVPHGLAGGFFLAPVAEWNVERGSDAYADLLPGGDAVRRIRELSERLDVPRSLSAFGVGVDDVPTLVEQTFLLEGALKQNPVPIDRDALHALLTALC